MPSRVHLGAAAAIAALLLPTGSAAGPAARGAVCGYPGYSYAGVQGPAPVAGVSARVKAVAAPAVASGHVAAWVGVGGAGMGPNGADDWVQAGIAAFAGGQSRLYYEYAVAGGAAPVLVPLAPVAVGEEHTVAVQEVPGRDGFWRVSIDGRVVGRPIFLAGSHDAWPPIATAETWDGGSRGCNRFSYAFSQLAVATTAGRWQPFAVGHAIRDPGFALRLAASGFAASTLASGG